MNSARVARSVHNLTAFGVSAEQAGPGWDGLRVLGPTRWRMVAAQIRRGATA